jgi:DNA-binding MarR family transcriptional regulator
MSGTTVRPRGGARLSAVELRAWRGLLRAHASLVKELDSELEQAHGLALSSFEVLARLEQSEGGRMRMRELAESVLLSRSGLTRLVDRLERDGLVRRGSCEHDARGAFAVITDRGRTTLLQSRATHLSGVRRHFLGCFSEAELDALGGYLERLVAAPASLEE